MRRILALITGWRSCHPSIVVNGYKRLLDGIEAEARPQVEQKYAEEWNASGYFQRLFLLRKINREVNAIVAERSKHVSKEALF